MDYLKVLLVVIVLLILWMLFSRWVKGFINVSSGPTLAFFSVDWCPHCKDFQPVWNDLRFRNTTSAQLLQIRGDKSKLYNVNSYPTIRFYPQGMTGDYVEYDGDRNVEALLSFLEQHMNMTVA